MGKLRLLGVAVFATVGILGIGVVSAAGDPGKASPPGQAKKADEHADKPSPPGQEKRETTEPAPTATTTVEQPAPAAPQQTLTVETAPSSHSHGKPAHAQDSKHADKTKPQSSPASAPAPTPVTKSKDERARGNSPVAHVHVIICHRTGSRSNPYIVINISKSAWLEGHTTHPPRNGNSDILLTEGAAPGEKLPKSACGTGSTPETPKTPPIVPTPDTPQPPTDQKPTVDAKPAADPKAADPSKPGQGGGDPVIPPVLPESADVDGDQGVAGAADVAGVTELPFTGLPLWIAMFAGCLLLASGLAVLKASWGAPQSSPSTSDKKPDMISR